MAVFQKDTNALIFCKRNANHSKLFHTNCISLKKYKNVWFPKFFVTDVISTIGLHAAANDEIINPPDIFGC